MTIRWAHRLDGLHPRLVAWVRSIDPVMLWGPEYQVAVLEGARSSERQAELYAQGRTTPGKKVTNAADLAQTAHGERVTPEGIAACAVDVVPYHVETQSIPWEGGDALWDALAASAEAAGLVSGRRWKMVDSPHVEVPGWQNWPLASAARLATPGAGVASPAPASHTPARKPGKSAGLVAVATIGALLLVMR